MNIILIVVFSFALIMMVITSTMALNLDAISESFINSSSLGSKTSSLDNVSIITPWNTGNERNTESGPHIG